MARSTKGVNVFDVLNVQEERNEVPMTEIIRAVDNIKEVSCLQLNLFKCVSQFYADVVITTDVSVLLCHCRWPAKVSVCANIVILIDGFLTALPLYVNLVHICRILTLTSSL